MEIEEVEEISKKDMIVKTIKNNKKVIMIGLGCGAAGLAVGLIFGIKKGGAVHSVKSIKLAWRSMIDVTMIQELERRGHPGMVVRCIETGEYFASQARAADALNISQSAVSRHLNGEKPHVKGYTFEVVGEAIK